MRLHYATNTISIAVAIALHEAGLEYEAVPVSFAQGEQTKPAYLSINPKARVPALETNGDILTETGAILEYIAAIAPHANLVPYDPIDAAKMRSVLFYLASTMHVNHAHRMRGSRWANEQSSFDDMASKVPETMTASAAYIETEVLGDTDLIFGDAPTLADINLFVVASWLPGDGVDIAGYPKLARFMTAMDARASVKAARASGMLA